VIVGFVFGYSADFALAGEALACAAGAVAGLGAGKLAVLCGHEKFARACMDCYSAVAVWKRIG
jgi:hypothetical protein